MPLNLEMQDDAHGVSCRIDFDRMTQLRQGETTELMVRRRALAAPVLSGTVERASSATSHKKPADKQEWFSSTLTTAETLGDDVGIGLEEALARCGLCDCLGAPAICSNCEMVFCVRCDQRTHFGDPTGSMAVHTRRLLLLPGQAPELFDIDTEVTQRASESTLAHADVPTQGRSKHIDPAEDWRFALPAVGICSRLQRMPHESLLCDDMAMENAGGNESYPLFRPLPGVADALPDGELWRAGLRRSADTGFGVRLYYSTNRQLVRVESVTPGGPADNAGLQAGDQVLSIGTIWLPGRVPDSFNIATATSKQLSPTEAIEWFWLRPSVGDATPSGASVAMDSTVTAETAAAAHLVASAAALLNSAEGFDDFSSAAEAFAAALEIDPESEPAAYGLQQARKAMEFARVAMNQVPSSPASNRRSTASMTADSSSIRGSVVGSNAWGGRGTVYRVISEAKARTGAERNSEQVALLQPGTKLEILAECVDSGGHLRLRYAQGWVSVQATNGTLLLEEDFDSSTGADIEVVCSGEKLVWSGVTALRAPSGQSWPGGQCIITTKRLIWYADPAAGDTPPGVAIPGRYSIAIPLLRVSAVTGRGGGFGLGLAEPFEATVDTLPEAWKGQISNEAGRWVLSFGRRGGERDELLKMCAAARHDCLRLEGHRQPSYLAAMRIRQSAKRALKSGRCKSASVAWLEACKESASTLQRRLRNAEGGETQARKILRETHAAVRAARDHIFVASGKNMREAYMSVPAWDSGYAGRDDVLMEGWARLVTTSDTIRTGSWRRCYLVLRPDTLAMYAEVDSVELQPDPAQSQPLFMCTDTLRLLDIADLNVGASPLAVSVTVSENLDDTVSRAAKSTRMIEIELEREQTAVDWIHGIWEAMEGQKASSSVGRPSLRNSRGELEQIEEQDRANTRVLHLISSQAAVATETFDLAMLEYNLQRANSGHYPQSNDIWNLKESIRSPSDWARPVAIMARAVALMDTRGAIVGRPRGPRRRHTDWRLLPSELFQQLIEVRDAINHCYIQEHFEPEPEPESESESEMEMEPEPEPVLVIEPQPQSDPELDPVREPALEQDSEPTIDPKDYAIESKYATADKMPKLDTRRRVLGGDDLLPIFIYVIARSCAGRSNGGWALAALAEWCMAIGAATDASEEEYMGTNFYSGLRHLANLELN